MNRPVTTPRHTPEPRPNRDRNRMQTVDRTTNGGPSGDRRSPEPMMPQRVSRMGLGRVELPTSRLSGTEGPARTEAMRARSNEVGAGSVRAESVELRAMHGCTVGGTVYTRTLDEPDHDSGFRCLIDGRRPDDRFRIVYGLADPAEPARIRYVGQTSCGAAQRYTGHIASARRDQSPRGLWIAGLLAEGRYPDMLLLEDIPPGMDLDLREVWWITELVSRGQADLNAPIAEGSEKRLRAARLDAKLLTERRSTGVR